MLSQWSPDHQVLTHVQNPNIKSGSLMDIASFTKDQKEKIPPQHKYEKMSH